MFQSSPVPKDGCNAAARTPESCLMRVSILTRPEGRVQRPHPGLQTAPSCFNPHPSRRTGATSRRPAATIPAPRFQSSPVPKDGCNDFLPLESLDELLVSILTRPEGRVQPARWRRPSRSASFQSSPVPKDGCNRLSCASGTLRFQSSPVPKDGCNWSAPRI
jgi:hypothetical protein